MRTSRFLKMLKNVILWAITTFAFVTGTLGACLVDSEGWFGYAAFGFALFGIGWTTLFAYVNLREEDEEY